MGGRYGDRRRRRYRKGNFTRIISNPIINFFFRSLSGSLSATGGSSLLVETFRGSVMRWCYLEITH